MANVFKYKHKVPDEYFAFLDEVPLESPAIGNYNYRSFLLAYLSYQYVKKGNTTINPFFSTI